MARRYPQQATDEPEITAAQMERAEGLERGTAIDWVQGSGFWSELADDEKLIATMPERQWISDVETMLDRGGQPASVMAALSLPLRSANLTIETPDGDTGQTEFVRDVLYSSGNQQGMEPDIVGVVSQMVQAIAVKRTYHEVVWHRRPDGRFGYKKIAWRPPSSCELIRDRRTGGIRGFQQYVDPATAAELEKARDPRDIEKLGDETPLGYVRIPSSRAVIHVHGQHRDPINGISDLAVTHWAYTMQQKILLMWATFLDGQSQPKVIAYGETKTEADATAAAIASLRGSGVLGIKRSSDAPEGEKLFDVLETGGNGQAAAQFAEMTRWLDQEMTRSVLAGFLDLTSNAATSGVGSYALSADQSGLFLQSRQAASKEISQTVTDQIIAPLVRVNFGPDAPVPRLVFEKMSKDTTDKAMNMLQQLGSSQAMNVPAGFIDLLVERIAQHLDLPDEKVEKMLEAAAEQRRVAAEQAGRSEEESETDRGQLTDNVNAAQDLLREDRQEKQ